MTGRAQQSAQPDGASVQAAECGTGSIFKVWIVNGMNQASADRDSEPLLTAYLCILSNVAADAAGQSQGKSRLSAFNVPIVTCTHTR